MMRLLCLLGMLSAASATVVKGTIYLILDPGVSAPGNNNIKNDINSALSECFTYKNADGSPMQAQGEGRSCATALLPGISTVITSEAAPEGAYQAWFGCEHSCEGGENCYPAKGPCGPTETLDYRKVSFTINSDYADGARAKSVGQNSDMMVAGLLGLIQAAAAKRSSASYPGHVYNYEITEIAATPSSQCSMPLAIDAGPQVNTAKQATHDWTKGPEDNGMSAGTIFGIVFAVLVVLGLVAVVAIHVKNNNSARHEKMGKGSNEMQNMA